MTREEHLAWCKTRALEYLDRGDVTNAVTSMLSDLGKHDETKIGPDGTLSMLGMNILLRRDHSLARQWIEGFR